MSNDINTIANMILENEWNNVKVNNRLLILYFSYLQSESEEVILQPDETLILQ